MSSEIAIKVENLSKCYQIYDQPHDRLKQFILPRFQGIVGRKPKQYFREFWALKDVSFELKKGETVGIIGSNGSGKSTLLQMICGTLNPTCGNIQTNGRIAALLELGSGFNPEFTGRENVYMNAAVLGLHREEIDERFDDIAAFADIGDFIEQPVKIYSSGMYVRLAFAVAIHVQPDVLVVDEALSVGDIRFQIKCLRKIDELKNSGRSIFLVTHSGSDVLRLCNRAIWLDKGNIRRIGESKKVFEEYSAWMVHDTNVIHRDSPSNGQIANTAEHGSLIPIPENAFITGDGGAHITGVGLLSEANELLTTLSGNERIYVAMKVALLSRIENPYFGFQIVNEKGLRIAGCNNQVLGLSYEALEGGQEVLIRFNFIFPEIENGQYLIALGVGDGTPENHIRHQYIADAYVFHIASSSPLQKQSVLLKLPNCVINFEKV